MMKAQMKLTKTVTENYNKLRKNCLSMIKQALEQANLKDKTDVVINNFIKLEPKISEHKPEVGGNGVKEEQINTNSNVNPAEVPQKE